RTGGLANAASSTQRFLPIVLSFREWNGTDHRQVSRRRGVVGSDAPSLPKLFTQRIAVATFSPFLGTAWQLSVPGDLPRAWPAPKAACRRISRPPRYRYARPRGPPRRGSRSGVAPLSRLPQMPTVLAEAGRSPTASLQATHAQR